MLKIHCWLGTLILTVLVGPAYAQKLENREMCRLYLTGVALPNGHSLYGGPDTQGKPVIFGKEFQVPEMRLKFLDAKTGNPVAPKIVNVRYFWLWLEWPYPEHDWGAWSDAEDWLKCTTGGDNELAVPAHIVKPVGWYNGKYTKFPYTLSGSKEPKFDRLEIVIEFDKWAPTLIIKARDLARYKDATAVVKLPYAGEAQVEFEKRPKVADPKSAEPSSRPDPNNGTSHTSVPGAAATHSPTPTTR